MLCFLKKYALYKVLEWLKSRFIAISCLCEYLSFSIRKHNLFFTFILLIRRKYIPTAVYITPVPQTTKLLLTEWLLLCFYPQIYLWISIQTNAFWACTLLLFIWFPLTTTNLSIALFQSPSVLSHQISMVQCQVHLANSKL